MGYSSQLNFDFQDLINVLLRSLQVIKPYNSLEAEGNAILQVCYTQLHFSFVVCVQRALDTSYLAHFFACLAIKTGNQEDKSCAAG